MEILGIIGIIAFVSALIFTFFFIIALQMEDDSDE